MVIKFIFFAAVGVLGTLAHYSVLFLLVEGLNYNPVVATGYGSLAGLVINYVLNFKITFNSSQSHQQAFPKFALIASLGMGLNLAMMKLLAPHLYYLYAQLLTTLLILLWNFFANTLWTFKMDKPSKLSLLNRMRLPASPQLFQHVLLFILSARLLTLGGYPLYDPSESRYAEMARKMLETGNWITPMIDYGVPFWGKPPLTIWLTALSMQMGGINEWAARLPAVLLSIAVSYTLFYLVKQQRNAEQAWSAVFVLNSSVLFFVMSGTVAMDLAMNLGITLALSAFWLALSQQKNQWGYVFFIGLSIGLMAKGPITLVLVGSILGLWTLITRRWQAIWQNIPWFTGTLLMLLICIPWYWLAEQRTPGFLEYFFIGEHWRRFTESGWKGDLYGAGRGHAHGMIWLYWLAAGFPWSLILLVKLTSGLLNKRIAELFRSADGWLLYCWLWALAPLLFFSFSANVIWTYVLPCLPGLALLLMDKLNLSTWQRSLLGVLVPIGFSGLVIYYQFPETDFYKSQKRLVETYTALAHPDEQLVYLKEKTEYSAWFYLQGKVTEVTDLDTLKTRLATTGHDYYVLRTAITDQIPELMQQHLQLIRVYGRYQLFHATGE